ncbi:MAG: hypothetical protein ABEK84_10280 [Salinibacter sp.]
MQRTVFPLFQVLLVIGALLLGPAGTAHAQTPIGKGEGTATLEGWPRSLPTLLREMGRKAPYLLPRIDSLALDYRYAATDSTSRWSFVLSWQPARRVLYEGDVLPLREGPADIHMTNVELRADVRVDGETQAEMIVAVDSMALRPMPNRFAFNVTVSHDRVFLNTSPRKARRLLRRGVTLGGLVVERMGFAAGDTERREGSPDARRRRDSQPRPPSIYTPRTQIYIGWRIAPRPYYIGDDDGDGDGDRKTRRPRGDTVGRSEGGGEEERGDAETRGEEGGRSRAGGVLSGKEEDEEDDEDDTDLQAPALAAAAAVGLVAFAGGTVGLYGRGDTPIGLASGYTRPSGGIQLQASINSAVLEDAPDQKLSVKALGFYDVFDSRVQPAVGLGVQIDPDRGRDWEPTVSGGLVGNFGRFVLYGGVDVVQGTPEVGLAYNVRFGTRE